MNAVESSERGGVYYNNSRLISIIGDMEDIEIVRVSVKNNTIISYLKNLLFLMYDKSVINCKYFIFDGFMPLTGKQRMIGIVNDLMTVTKEVRKSLKRRIVMRIYFHLLKLRAYKIIVISKATASALVKKYGIDRERLEIIYPVIETPPNVVRSSKISNKDSGVLKLVFIGANRSNKNIPTLIRAVEILRKRKVKASLSLIGPYSHEDYLQLLQLLRNLSVWDIVTIHSNISADEKYDILRHSDFLILPSFQEGFGMPCIEAFSVGLPVICSDIPVLHEVTEDYGIFFDPGSPDSLVNTILEARNRIFDAERMKLISERYGVTSAEKKLKALFLSTHQAYPG